MREKKEINIQIGEQIKLAREQAKLTKEALAEYIDVSPQYVSDLERGVVGVSSVQILFGKVLRDRAAVFAAQCSCLTHEQYRILMEIADRFVAAVDSAR